MDFRVLENIPRARKKNSEWAGKHIMAPSGGRSLPSPGEKFTFVYNIQGVDHWKIEVMRVFSIFKNLEKK